MEMGAFTGALVALLAKDMGSAIASEMGKDVSAPPSKRCAGYVSGFAGSQTLARRWSSWQMANLAPCRHGAGWSASSIRDPPILPPYVGFRVRRPGRYRPDGVLRELRPGGTPV